MGVPIDFESFPLVPERLELLSSVGVLVPFRLGPAEIGVRVKSEPLLATLGSRKPLSMVVVLLLFSFEPAGVEAQGCFKSFQVILAHFELLASLVLLAFSRLELAEVYAEAGFETFAVVLEQLELLPPDEILMVLDSAGPQAPGKSIFLGRYRNQSR